MVLGVDCGGTRTRAVAADSDGCVLGEGRAGPANLREAGAEGVAREVGVAAGGALRAAGVRPGGVGACFVGVAGCATESERAMLVRALGGLGLGGRLGVDHDLRTAQAGAFAGGAGVVVIAGTGSCAYGRTGEGAEARAGGWGGRLDDGGSATWLGLQGLASCARAADGRGGETALGARLLPALGVADLRAALGVVEASDYRRRVAVLAPLVTRCAEEGDGVAREIVRAGCRELACMALAAQRSLGGVPGAWLPISVAGGVFASGLVRECFGEATEEHMPGCGVARARMPGVLGAVVLALGVLGGGGPGPAALARLSSGGAA
jgi:glucosamine kinase